ncbi:Zinc finger protein AZF2 [Acorus gramineus]|uniref:Zinc finger protein AZF2 n=1 Tax=Acorus gramineus TaxID=55184 RepID=A0AAV9AUN0_ACOGR|nr:Zinc finger protein AZF2 [Acorus gramineus]
MEEAEENEQLAEAADHMTTTHQSSSEAAPDPRPPRKRCTPEASSSVTKNSTSSSSRRWTCRICGRSFAVKNALFGHMRSHRREQRPHQTLAAAATHAEWEAAAALLLLSRGGSDGNASCGKTLDSYQALEGYRASNSYNKKKKKKKGWSADEHVPLKEYRCKKCEKVFPSGQALGGHMTLHLNERPTEEEEVVVPPQPIEKEEEEGAPQPTVEPTAGHLYFQFNKMDG